MTKFKNQLLLAGCLLCITSQGIAKEKAVANELFRGNTLAFDLKGNFSNATVSISGPNNYNASITQRDGAPTVNLSQVGTLVDGKYNYEITVATDETIAVTDNLNNGRGENARTTMNVGKTQSGHFRVKDGAIVTYLDITEGE